MTIGNVVVVVVDTLEPRLPLKSCSTLPGTASKVKHGALVYRALRRAVMMAIDNGLPGNLQTDSSEPAFPV